MNRKTIFVASGLVCTVATVHAQNATSDVGGTFQQVQTAANAWIPAIMAAATRLFYLLAAIDFAWSAPSFLRESDFMGLFLSLIKKLLVISFFYAVLVNGQTWIPAIVNSFITIGTNATGLSAARSPSDIMAQGIQICSDLFDKVNGANLLTQTGAALTTILMIVMVFASYLIIVLHYIVTKLEAIIVMTAGYIFLGFAGSRWTMPYFERYISLAISTGVRLMLIYLMLGVFKTVSQNWVTAMDSYTPDQPALQIFPTIASMLLFAFASWMIPKMAGSIASGSLGLGGADVVNAGAAAATGAALAVATVASGGALAAGGTAAAGAGGIEALGAAVPVVSAKQVAVKDVRLQEATVARWITNLRTVVIDPVVQRKMVDEVYGLASASSAASQALTDWYKQNSPFARLQKETVDVSVESIVQQSSKSYEVVWAESTHDLFGQLQGTHRYRAIVTVNTQEVSDPKQALINPLGLYVTNFSWGEVVSPSSNSLAGQSSDGGQGK